MRRAPKHLAKTKRGQTMIGVDGRYWESVEDKNGRWFWKRVSGGSSGKRKQKVHRNLSWESIATKQLQRDDPVSERSIMSRIHDFEAQYDDLVEDDLDQLELQVVDLLIDIVNYILDSEEISASRQIKRFVNSLVDGGFDQSNRVASALMNSVDALLSEKS